MSDAAVPDASRPEGTAPYDPYALPPDALREPPHSLWTALKQIGPGIILAGSIIGTGELLQTTKMGAEHGFAFLWLILFSCVSKVFIQVELGRHALSSGKPTLAALDALPGPRLGTHWLVWWWFFMLLATVFQLGAMVGGVGQAIHLLWPQSNEAIVAWLQPISPYLADKFTEHPSYPWAAPTALVAIGLLLSGGYKRIEVITTLLVVAVTGVTVVCVLVLPFTGFSIPWPDVGRGLLVSLPADGQGVAIAFSVFGITGVGASELYAYPYWCLEKGYARFTGVRQENDAWAHRARGWLRVMYLDAWVSMLVFTVATVSFYFMGATVLHKLHLVPEKKHMMERLAQMYVQAFGHPLTKTLFLIGGSVVLFKTLYVATASNSRLSADFVSLARFTSYADASARVRWINRFCVFYPLLALVLFFAFGDPAFMVLLGGFAQAVTLPLISGAAIYLRYKRTDRRLAPSLFTDICVWIAFLLIAAAALYSAPIGIQDLWKSLLESLPFVAH
ncbi:MAG TPA: Nramp family divalent metal transporter [Pirellulales bacterium]|nr:Nramp family divalent metal transporter [Pirellulales bacterium]